MLVSVTSRAGESGMKAGQREIRRFMIEARLRPTRLDVAIAADLSEARPVNVLLEMTTNAGRVRLSESHVAEVTASAIQIRVTVQQREIRAAVIECVPVEPDDIGVPALVLRMTARAGEFGDRRVQAVKSGARTDVGGNLDVTVNAELALRLLGEGPVAEAALALVFRVAGHHRTRHQDCLEGLRPSRACSQDAGDSRHDQEPPNSSLQLPQLTGPTIQYMCTART
jgi:hypothetical protein